MLFRNYAKIILNKKTGIYPVNSVICSGRGWSSQVDIRHSCNLFIKNVSEIFFAIALDPLQILFDACWEPHTISPCVVFLHAEFILFAGSGQSMSFANRQERTKKGDPFRPPHNTNILQRKQLMPTDIQNSQSSNDGSNSSKNIKGSRNRKQITIYRRPFKHTEPPKSILAIIYRRSHQPDRG